MSTLETAAYAGRALDELPALWEGMARLVRAGMGITAFGANVFELPPDYLTESHDEAIRASRSSTSRCAARAPW